MRRVLFLPFCFLLTFISALKAQKNQSTCAEDKVMKELFRLNPSLKTRHEEIEQNRYTQVKEGKIQQRPTEDVVTLPVVFHIIHNNGPENINDARVLAGLQHLNEAFANTGYYNPATGVDTKIQFCLAQRDPNGNSTTGINRVVSSYTNTNGVNNYSEDIALKDLSRWNPRCYINIWVVADITGSVAGYAYLPSAHGDIVDGIVLESKYLGSSYSNDVVIIHEMGHYLGLYHTFEDGCRNNDCTKDGDKVCDTPPDNSVGSVGCSTSINSCNTDILSGFSADQNDQKENFMDYGNFSCMELFTQGQKERMRWHVENVRSSLLTCRSCLPPCTTPVTTNFTSSANNITTGTVVNFTNSSLGASSYEWFIDGVSQGVTPNFNHQFNTTGIYIVKLVAYSNNSSLCADGIKEDTIRVTCPLQTYFVPSATEVLPGTTVTFTNSTVVLAGVPSYQWYVNGALIATTLDASYDFAAPGEYAVKLVASNGICSTVYESVISVYTPCTAHYFDKIYSSDNYHILPTDVEQLADSTYLGCARMYDFTPGNGGAKGFVIKHSSKGNIIWAKLLNDPTMLVDIHDMEILNDGSMVYIGQARRGSSSQDVGVFIVKLDSNGNILWQKRYVFPGLGIETVYYERTHIKEAENSNLVISCGLRNYAQTINIPVVGTLTANGDVIWLKKMVDASKPEMAPTSIMTNQNSIYWFLDNRDVGILTKLNLETGSIIFKQQYFLAAPGNNNLRFLESRLKENVIQIYGSNPSEGYDDSVKHIIVHIDTLGAFQKAVRIKLNAPGYNIYFYNFETRGTITSNGDAIFTEGPTLDADPVPIAIYRGDINNNTVYSKTLIVSRKRRVYKVAEGIYNNTILYGNVDALGGNTKAKLYLRNAQANGEVDVDCPVGPLTYSQPSANITQSEFNYTGFADFTFTLDPSFNLVVENAILSTTSICGTQSNPCYKLQIEGIDSICGTTDSITFVAKRNQGCSDPVLWSVSPATYGSRILSDSSIRIRFLQPGDYKIIGTLSSCQELADTFNVNVSRSAATLSLGPDDELCDISTYVVKAGPGFKSYLWQNGSVDSIFTAYYPGTYLLTVTDYCNNTKSDTIVIGQAPAVPFDLGNDLMYCRNDTMTITAPVGFIDYSWASSYNISSTSGQVVKVWPLVDTMYSVVAKVREGCIVADSIRIIVKAALPLDLGDDLTFCDGEFAIIDAGVGFNSYEWNTGSTNSSITVNHTGTYTIKATSADGCVSKDTVVVTNVFTPRVINLGKDTTVCKSVPLTLNAGQGFIVYEWSTGATTSQIDIDAIGTYWVKATDVNNCVSQDTINILDVVECKKAIYFPKAFTPNNDNLNDFFRPVVYGVLKKYHLTVYNQWGQKIFESKDPGKGWDGRLGGAEQSTANFVWFASYQFEAELPASNKGTVVLIR
jgi:gliding motility-associated-like protein